MTKDSVSPSKMKIARQAILIGTSPLLMLLGWTAFFKADFPEEIAQIGGAIGMLLIYFIPPTLIAGAACLAGNFWAWVVLGVQRKALRFFVLLCCNLPFMGCAAWNAYFAANLAPKALALSISLFLASMVYSMRTLWLAADEPEPIRNQPTAGLDH